MSRLYGIAVVLLLGAVAFGIGYQIGLAERPVSPRQRPPARAVELEGDAARLQEVLLEPDPLVRAEQLARLLRGLEPGALPDVLRTYETVFFDRGDVELTLLAEWWTRFDPAAAFAFTFEDWRADHPSVVLAVLRSWARRDPPAALAAAQAKGMMALRRPYLHAVLAGWDESEPQQVEQWIVERLPDGQDQQRAAALLAQRRVLRLGPEGAFDWAEDLRAPESFKQYVFQRVVGAAAEVDPRLAGEWVREQVDGPYGRGLTVRLGMAWGKREPAAALDWFSGLPPGRPREDGVRETYRAWIRRDVQAARAWIESRENALEDWMDPVVAIHAEMEARREPETALAWAQRIHDPRLREATIIRATRNWIEQDREAAEAWLAAADLPEKVKMKAGTLPPARQFWQERKERKAQEEAQQAEVADAPADESRPGEERPSEPSEP